MRKAISALVRPVAPLTALAAVALSLAACAGADETVLACDPKGCGTPQPTKSVRVTAKREGDVTHFYVENDEYCEVTMTLQAKLSHLNSDRALPLTAVFPARSVTEAFTVTPADAKGKWAYSYTNHYMLGGKVASHNDSELYELPYAPGRKFEVTQGYNGSFSHTGTSRYAIDWEMPAGTPVRAARGGMVVRVKDDSDRGGSSMKFDRWNNYVLVRHEDGTLGYYCHLQKGGVCVQPGQTVKTGELLAHSGNTGFSSGPHLHFCVLETKDSLHRESVPVKFRAAGSEGLTLQSSHSYTAAAVKSGAQPARGASALSP